MLEQIDHAFRLQVGLSNLPHLNTGLYALNKELILGLDFEYNKPPVVVGCSTVMKHTHLKTAHILDI